MIERIVLAGLIVSACQFSAQMAQAPAFTIAAAWIREPVPGQAQAAAYGVIENPGAADLQIVAAASGAAGVVEIHETVRTGDRMRMAPVKSVTVPAHGKLELKPGGLHLMLFQLKRTLKDGDATSLTLTAASGAAVKVILPVKRVPMP